jgi:hypothetical protein
MSSFSSDPAATQWFGIQAQVTRGRTVGVAAGSGGIQWLFYQAARLFQFVQTKEVSIARRRHSLEAEAIAGEKLIALVVLQQFVDCQIAERGRLARPRATRSLTFSFEPSITQHCVLPHLQAQEWQG